MPHNRRLELLREIADARHSYVISYIVGDRQPLGSAIAEDAVRPFYDHLLAPKRTNRDTSRIDLFLYSRGGDVVVPWRLVTMLREFCNELNVIIPFRAHSAATMIALGADNVLMGPKAELSPIDPSMVEQSTGPRGGPVEIGVEDVSSYIDFIQKRVGLRSQEGLSSAVTLLADKLGPWSLGRLNREYSYIRLVASKLLHHQNQKWKRGQVRAIIKELTQGLYSHRHAIGRKEAKDLGLPIVYPDTSLENKIWDLYSEYENLLHLAEPVDPWQIFSKEQNDVVLLPKVDLAVIESESHMHAFRTSLRVVRKRQIPSALQIAVNLNIGLSSIPGSTAPPQERQQFVQQFLQDLQKVGQNQIARMVQEQINAQAPVVGFDWQIVGGSWQEVTTERA